VRFGLPVFAIVATLALIVAAAWQALRPATEVDAVAVVIRGVETRDSPGESSSEGRIIQAPGWVEADPFTVYAAALTEGVVEEVLVLEGDRVEQGQPIATLNSDDARIMQERARAALQLAERRLATARAAHLAIEPEIAAARASLRALADEHRRKAALVDDGAVAAGPVARLAIALDAAEAGIARLEARREVLDAEAQSADAAVAVAAAGLAEADLARSRTVIRSPMDGVIMERLASPGSLIRFSGDSHASHIVHLYDPARLQVRADVPLADAAGVGIGHPAEIVVDVLPNTTFSGEVTRLVHRADLQKNTVEAKVRIDDPADLLKPDMLARVRILQPPADNQDSATRLVDRAFVPEEAILPDGSIMTISADGRAQQTAITLGESIVDGWREVTSGLSHGDRVILSNVKPGAFVTPSEKGSGHGTH
jgi:RND family efflux transporter MFP subunit